MKIYFAHPVPEYGTTLERECLELIYRKFKGCFIVNPADEGHFERYEKEGMDYFLGLARGCGVVVAMRFLNGLWGAGVFSEVCAVERKDGKIYEIVMEWVKDTPHPKSIVKIDFENMFPMSLAQTRATRRMIRHYRGN